MWYYKSQEIYSFPAINKRADGKTFEGYNEMDICFTMPEDAEIKENANF